MEAGLGSGLGLLAVHLVERSRGEAHADRALQTGMDATHVDGRAVQDSAVVVACSSRQPYALGAGYTVCVVERWGAACLCTCSAGRYSCVRLVAVQRHAVFFVRSFVLVAAPKAVARFVSPVQSKGAERIHQIKPTLPYTYPWCVLCNQRIQKAHIRSRPHFPIPRVIEVVGLGKEGVGHARVGEDSVGPSLCQPEGAEVTPTFPPGVRDGDEAKGSVGVLQMEARNGNDSIRSRHIA